MASPSSTLDDFDTPESFRGRFEWAMDEEKRGQKKESHSTVSSLRRLAIRRHRYSRCCKVITVLVVSMMLTQAFFFYTGGSVSAFDYKRAMPMAIFFDPANYEYGEAGDFGQHHDDEEYEALLEDNDQLAQDLIEDEGSEGDYEYKKAIEDVRQDIEDGPKETTLADEESFNEQLNNTGPQNFIFIPRNAPLPPTPKPPADKLPPLPKEKQLISLIFPGDHSAEDTSAEEDGLQQNQLPPEQLNLLQPQMPVQQEANAPEQSQEGQVLQPQLQQLFPGMQNLEQEQHDGIISLDQLQVAHAEHEQHIQSLQEAQGSVQTGLGAPSAPGQQLNDEQLLRLLTKPPTKDESAAAQHVGSVIDHLQQQQQQLQLQQQQQQQQQQTGEIAAGAPDSQQQQLPSKESVMTPELISLLLQYKDNPAEQARIVHEAMAKKAFENQQQQQQQQQQAQLEQQQQQLQQQQQQQQQLLQPQQIQQQQEYEQQQQLQQLQQQEYEQQQQMLQQQVLLHQQEESQAELLSDHKDPAGQFDLQLIQDQKDVQSQRAPSNLFDDRKDPNFSGLMYDHPDDHATAKEVDVHEEHLSDEEMKGIESPYTGVSGDRTSLGLSPAPDFIYGYFPDGFMWSVATAAFQIEGGWNEDGKGKSIWDVYTHEGHVEDGSNAHIACDSYHKYLDDVVILKELGVKHYRFSIAWTRIQPTGMEKEPNHRGIEYYNRLINALLNANIQPVVTLYHWDLPQALQDRGGWLNTSFIADAFSDYARMCFEHFGDRVKFWVTINEPSMVAWIGYGRGRKAPGIHGESDLVYIAGHNLIRAHAKAYRVYQKEFQAKQRGFVGISLNIVWKEPKTSDPKDIEATERAMQFELGWFANPIYGNGDYPEIMKKQIARKSRENGLPRSRLPEFTPEEIELNKGTSDFFGLNTYTSRLVEHFDQPNRKPTYFKDQDVKYTMDPNWQMGARGRAIYPEGLRRLLSWISRRYGPRPIYITENGISDNNGTLEDYHRIDYLKKYINAVLKAITIDGVRVVGYTVWTLMDNFEWERGYQEKLGLYHVDFADPVRPRTAKASAKFYNEVIANNGFPPPF